MSISSAFSSAVTGLYAAGRASSVVSDNLANALTPGFSRRTLSLSSNGDGIGGVRINGVSRVVDPAVQSSRRVAEAEFGNVKVTADFFGRMSNLVGTVDDEFSIASRMSNFDGALIEAISRPDSTPRLNDLAVQAESLVTSISAAAEGLRDMRTGAERSIGIQVTQVNDALKGIEKLNARIAMAESAGMNSAALNDQRDQLVDQVNEIIPVKVVARENGRVALFTTGGAILIDGPAAELSFDGKRDTMPHMTIDNGLLSGLQINGRDINTSPNGPLAGGTLAAQFEVRDRLTVEAQEDLDTMAQDLVQRFQDPTLDTTLGATDPGLFTDDGAFYDPTNMVGLSNRLTLNSKVSLDGDAETWRFRDGLNAASVGDAGDASLLSGYATALHTNLTVSSVGLGTSNIDAINLSSALLSRFAQADAAADQGMSFASAVYNEMSQLELSMGVDSDTELQNLMLIEQAYGANAKVLSVVDELMATLLRI